MSFLPRRKIIAPVDFSDLSLEAIEVAIDIAGGQQAVGVLHVLPELSIEDPVVAWSKPDEEHRKTLARDELAEVLAQRQYKEVAIEVRIGDPGQEIADYAAEVGADLIVISSHGRTGVKRLLIGSVAERVVRLAHCPVLVLRK
jgi:nucleotide-binding universal stress UspA family protein